jgi:hypothetical protein
MSKHYHSQCHCGQVKINFVGSALTVVQCHCQNCRQLNGSDYSSWAFIPEAQLEVKDPHQNLRRYTIESGSWVEFCQACGTKVRSATLKHFDGTVFGIPLGTIRNWDETLCPKMQAYTEYKAVWHSLAQQPPSAPTST